MDSIKNYIMMALLVAGAAYGLASITKIRTGFSSLRIAVLCSGVVVACGVGLVAVALMSSQNSFPQ